MNPFNSLQKKIRTALLGLLGFVVVIFLVTRFAPGISARMMVVLFGEGVESSIVSGNRFLCNQALDTIKKSSESERQEWVPFFENRITTGVNTLPRKGNSGLFTLGLLAFAGVPPEAIGPHACFTLAMKAMGSSLYPIADKLVRDNNLKSLRALGADVIREYINKSPGSLKSLTTAVANDHGQLVEFFLRSAPGSKLDFTTAHAQGLKQRLDQGKSLSENNSYRKFVQWHSRKEGFAKHVKDFVKHPKMSEDDKVHIVITTTSYHRDLKQELFDLVKDSVDVSKLPRYMQQTKNQSSFVRIRTQAQLDSLAGRLRKEIATLEKLEEKETWTKFEKVVKDLTSASNAIRTQNDKFNTDSLYGAYFDILLKIKKSGLLKYGVGYTGIYSRIVKSAARLDLITKLEPFFLAQAKSRKNLRPILGFLFGMKKVSDKTKKEIVAYAKKVEPEDRMAVLTSLLGLGGWDEPLSDEIFSDLLELAYKDSSSSFSNIYMRLFRINRKELPRYIILFDKRMESDKSPKRKLFYTAMLSLIKRDDSLQKRLATMVAKEKKCHSYFHTAAHIVLRASLDKENPKIFTKYLTCPLHPLKLDGLYSIASHPAHLKILKAKASTEKNPEKKKFFSGVIKAVELPKPGFRNLGKRRGPIPEPLSAEQSAQGSPVL